METIKYLFRDLLDLAIDTWDKIMKNLGWILSICYGGMWFAFFNGFNISIIAIHSWFVTSILTLVVWGVCGVGIAFVLVYGYYLILWGICELILMFDNPQTANAQA